MKTGSSPVIVHVDDRESNRYTVRRFLESSGFEVHQAANGTDGIQLIREVRPELVILDVKLPDFSGFELCRRIKSDPEMAPIPVMHVSAHFTDIEARVEGLDSGADAYLTNINGNELLATVRALLRARKAEEEARSKAAEWHSTFNSVSDPIVLLECGGKVVQANRSATYLFNSLEVDKRELLYQQLAGFCSGMMGPAPPPHREVSAGGKVYRLSFDRVESTDEREAGCVCVLADVSDLKNAETEIRRINDELIRARDAAVQANRAKSAFLASMSHELRTPLNAIIGYTEILHEDLAAGKLEGTLKDLHHIRSSARHLLQMVAGILDLSRIEAGRTNLQLDSYEVAALVEDVVDSVLPLAEQRGNTITLEVQPQELGSIWTDGAKLRQILLNLLSNACKFTANGKILVRAERSVTGLKDRVFFQVTDSGIGIEPDKLESVFEAYQQADHTISAQYGGTGLGLAISRRLADVLQGTLTVESSFGEGSTFTLSIPANVEDA